MDDGDRHAVESWVEGDAPCVSSLESVEFRPRLWRAVLGPLVLGAAMTSVAWLSVIYLPWGELFAVAAGAGAALSFIMGVHRATFTNPTITLDPEGYHQGRSAWRVTVRWSNIVRIEHTGAGHGLIGITLADVEAVEVHRPVRGYALRRVIMRLGDAMMNVAVGLLTINSTLIRHAFVRDASRVIRLTHEIYGHHLVITTFLADRPMADVFTLLESFQQRFGDEPAEALVTASRAVDTRPSTTHDAACDPAHPPLADEPAPVEVRRDTTKQVIARLGASLGVFGICALVMLSHPDLLVSALVTAVFAALLFLLLVTFLGLRWFPDPCWRLDARGLTVRGTTGEETISWSAIESCRVVRAPFQKADVVLELAAAHAGIRARSRQMPQLRCSGAGRTIRMRSMGLDRPATSMVTLLDAFRTHYGSRWADAGES